MATEMVQLYCAIRWPELAAAVLLRGRELILAVVKGLSSDCLKSEKRWTDEQKLDVSL